MSPDDLVTRSPSYLVVISSHDHQVTWSLGHQVTTRSSGHHHVARSPPGCHVTIRSMVIKLVGYQFRVLRLGFGDSDRRFKCHQGLKLKGSPGH